MAKDKITEYDATANNNTQVGGVNLAENSALPSDMNNAIREVMSHQKEAFGSGTPLFVDQTNNRVCIGTTTEGVAGADELTVGNTSAGNGITIRSGTSNSGALYFSDGTSGASEYDGGFEYNHSSQFMRFLSAGAEKLRLTSDGKVGIGDTTPDGGKLHVTNSTGAIGYFESTQASANVDNIVLNSTQTNSSANLSLQINDGTSAKGQVRLNGDNSVSIQNGTSLTERLRIDGNGNVIIGETTTINSGFLNLATSASSNTLSMLCRSTTDSHECEIIMQKSGTDSGNFSATADDEGLGVIKFRGVDTSGVSRLGASIACQQNGTSSSSVPADLVFNTSGSERMRIILSGRITTFGCTGTNGSINLVGEGGLSSRAVAFQHVSNGSEVGSIITASSSTSYNTSSDYRLKENVNYNFDATARLKQLKPCTFNWIADEDSATVDGFLAHEVSSIIPEAISGKKDEVDGNKEPIYQQIDQSKLIPLLTKTLQEALTRIDTLEAEVKTLKGE